MSDVSLRNHFAGLAMLAELITAGASHDAADNLVAAAKRAGRTVEQHIAVNAYSMANFMLAQSSHETADANILREKLNSYIVTEGGQALACSENVRLEHDRLRGMLEKLGAFSRKQGRELGDMELEIERLLGEIKRKDAALDHPLLRQLFGEIEDSGTKEANRLWQRACAWFAVRDAALSPAEEGKEAR